MTKEEIKHIVNQYFRKLKKQYESIDPRFEAEAIHQFRVAYKKLRAFFRLVSVETGEKLKIPNKLKKSYKALGAIRDLQLQQHRIKEIVKLRPKKLQVYQTKLGKEIQQQKREMKDSLSQGFIWDAKKRTVGELPPKLSRNIPKDFVQVKQSNNNNIINSGDFSDDNLHSIRKNLKDIYYVEEIFNEKNKNRSSRRNGDNQEEDPAKEFLDKMGDFQDKRTGIALIKNSWLMQFSKNDREILTQIKLGWMKDKLNMKRSLLRKLRSPNFQLTWSGN